PDIDLPPEARPVPEGNPEPIKKVGGFTAVDRTQYQTLSDRSELEAFLGRAKSAGRLSFDLETTSLEPTRAEIVGVALAIDGEAAAYVPVAHHYLGVPKQLPLEDVLGLLKPVLTDPSIELVGQNLKYDMVVLGRYSISIASVADDSMVAAYVLDPGRLSFSLDTLSRELLDHDTVKYSDIAGTGKNQKRFDEITVDVASEYAAEDADVAMRLATVLPQQIDSLGMTSLYRDIELPLVPVLAAMESRGVLIDVEQLGVISGEITQRIRKVEETAQAMVGEQVNLGSPKQLGHLLFEKLGLPVVKKTKTGYSTDQEVLETLAREHELPKVILEHRMLTKLKSTYVDALPKMVNPDTGRVHTSFNQTGTATGRLSSSDPNLQNIPIRTDEGRRIRDCFIAPEGSVLIAADYSQIELRIMAHLSEDEDFVDAFKKGEDIHTRTAQEILTGGGEPSAEDRRRAKAINFGILYGLSEYGLSRQLSIPRREAADYIKAYFARYPKIRY
ncbi:MAG: DNA polymerase, partial [Myxococcota bacterium]